MCRVILTALLAVGLFAVCVLTALWMQPGALSKLSATQSEADTEESIALHPNAIARMRAQMARRVAPWQPQAAQFVQERVAMHYNVAKPKKPLVLSFQGCEECGQMTILEVLGQSLWDAKHQKRCVHAVDINMLDALSDAAHERHICDDVIKTLRKCPRAVLYFDEIDLLLPTMYRTIVSIIEGRAWDHRANATLPAPAKASFIFLSGAGGNTLLQMALRKGSVRNAVPMAIAQDALVKLFQPDNREFWGHEKAANVLWPKVALGLEKTILSFVPFFPLRRVDVRACLKGEVEHSLATLKELGLVASHSVDDALFDWLVRFYPEKFLPDPPHLTNKGCKGATQLVAQRVYGGAQEIMQSVSASSSTSSSSSHDDDGASSAAKTGPFSDKHIHLSAPPKPPKSEEAAGMDAEDADREEQMAAPVAAITVFAAADAPPKIGGKQMEKEMAKQYRVMMREFRRRRAEEKEKERAGGGASDGASPSGSAPSVAAHQAAAALSARARARQFHNEL